MEFLRNRGPAPNAGQPGFTLEELDLLSQDSRDWLLSGARGRAGDVRTRAGWPTHKTAPICRQQFFRPAIPSGTQRITSERNAAERRMDREFP
jgi:hypothetical protein